MFGIDDTILISLIGSLVTIGIKYGLPYAEQLILSWSKEEITLEDIIALKDGVFTPEQIQAKIDMAK